MDVSSMQARFSILVAVTMVSVLPQFAVAQVPDATYIYNGEYVGPGGVQGTNGNNGAIPGTFNGSGCNVYGCFSDSASAIGLTTQVSGQFTGVSSSPYAPGSVQNPSAVEASAGALISFSYEVLGPSSVYVPLIITGNFTATTSGGANAVSNVNSSVLYNYTTSTGTITGNFTACSSFGGTCGSPSSGTLNASFSDLVNTVNTVQIGTSASSAGIVTSSFAGLASAVISIDPTFLAQNPGYSLVFSSNISATPEPEAYLLMVVGLGLLGFTARARRTNR